MVPCFSFAGEITEAIRTEPASSLHFVFKDNTMATEHKRPSRFARRMANRLAKAIGRANKHVNRQFAVQGVREVIQSAAAHQFRHFTRDLVRHAQAEEAATFGRELSHHEHMLRRKAFRAERMAA